MRNNDARFAKLANFFIYFIMTILVLIAAMRSSHFEEQEKLFVFAIGIMSIWVYRILSGGNRVRMMLHAMLTVALMFAAAYIGGVATGRGSTFQMLLFIPMFSILLYIDARVFRWAGMSLIIAYVITIFCKFPAIESKPLGFEAFVFVPILVIGNLIGIYFTKLFNFEKRKSAEMEQSLDDLLKVVWAKCSEAKDATKSKSAFLSSMSHEIRTPINAVLGMNELILQKTEDEKIIEYANDIESSGKILLGLINDILDFSKIESGKMDLVEVEYHVSSMINDLINLIQPKADEKELEFLVEVSSDIPNVLMGDDLRVKQVITNLLSNAVKYTQEGQVRLKVSSRQIDGDALQLIFDVEDTGIGMKQEDLENLFDSFSRFDSVKNRTIQGTGLGMAIVKQIVDLYEGDIQVESVYGEGTKYHVIIPQKIVDCTPMGDFQENYKKSRPKNHHRTKYLLPSARILVVDDNAMNLKVAQGLLSVTKAKVSVAMSGRECINMLEKEVYDLVLLDHMMPQMDGVETLKEIKERELAKDTPILALTANAISGAKEMYLSYGFDDYLTKPISGEMLQRALVKWLPSRVLEEVPEEERKHIAPQTVSKEKKPEMRGVAASNEKVHVNAAKPAGHSKKVDFIKQYVNMETALQYSIDGENGVLFNMDSFARRIGDVQNELQQAIAEKDFAMISQTAHAMESMATIVGLDGVCKMTKDIKDACAAGCIEVCEMVQEKLTSYLETCIMHFSQYVVK